MQEAAQLLANREPLLRRQNHAGMPSPGADPLRVKAIEIGHVECVEDTPALGGEGQLFVVRLLGETGVQSRDHDNATRTKSRDKSTMHRIFVEVELDPIHGRGSAPVLSFQNLGLAVLGCQVCVDFLLVGEVAGKSRMNLRQRQVTSERLHDLFRNLTHVVPLSDPANGDTRPGNARPPAANVRASRDQATYLGDGCHAFQHNTLGDSQERAGQGAGCGPERPPHIENVETPGTRQSLVPRVWPFQESGLDIKYGAGEGVQEFLGVL